MTGFTRSNDDLDSLVGEVADDYLRRQERGERPEPEEYAALHPHAALAIHRALRSLRLVPVGVDGSAAIAGVLAEHDSGSLAFRGQMLGDYRIIREVGRGGMGVVYEAEQVSLGRRVALKVLPFAALSDSRLLLRFKNEARAAAALDHSHVVKVHAVGEERGVHYLAMQFIDGRPLSDFIRERRTGETKPPANIPPDAPTATNASAEAAVDTAPVAKVSTNHSRGDSAYFRQVAAWGIQAAESLEHAHSMGVVHRDVKPGNLLLDKSGQVWVADFGLAKLAASDAGVTASGDMLGTLRYMSPEQAGAKHGIVDHRTDVYALGATLYELLTGVPAVGGDDKAEILRKIVFEEPVAPRKHERGVPADLETVVLKCLTKEPAERYATAAELAADLYRYLRNESIEAKRPTALARANKWLRRHSSIVFTASTVALIAMIVGTTLVWRQSVKTNAAYEAEAIQRREAEQNWERAEQNWELAEQTVEDMYAQVASKWLKGQRRLEPLQREFLEKAIAFYQRFAQQRGDEPSVRHSIGRAQLRLGELHKRLERPLEAEIALDRALEIFTALAIQVPDVPEYRAQQAYCLKGKGDLLLTTCRLPEAEQCVRQAIGLRSALLGELPNSATNRREFANCYTSLGLIIAIADRPKEAEIAHRRAVELLEAELKMPHDGDDCESKLANSRLNLANEITVQGRFDEAEVIYRQSMSTWEQLSRRRPADADVRNGLGESYANMAALFRRAGRPPKQEEELHRRALANQEELVALNPAIAGYRSDLASMLNNLAVFLNTRGDKESATQLYNRSVDILDRLVAEAPTIRQYHEGLGSSLVNLGKSQIRLKRYAEAEKSLDRAREVLTRLSKETSSAQVREYLAGCLAAVGSLNFETNKLAEAQAAMLQAQEIRRGVLTENPESLAARDALATGYEQHALFLAQKGRFPDAVTTIGLAFPLREKLAAEYPKDAARRDGWAQDLYRQAEWLQRAGRRPEAQAGYERAIAVSERLEADFPGRLENRKRLAGCRNNLAVLLIMSGRSREAEQCYRQALADLELLTPLVPNSKEHLLTLAGIECNISRLLAERGEYGKAEEQLRHALTRLPDSPDACNSLADLILTRPDTNVRNVKEALALAKKAVEGNPKNGDIRNTLGLAYYRNGNWPATIHELEESMRLRNGGDSHDYFVLALAHWQQKDKAEARKWFDRGVTWMDNNRADDAGLKRMRAEAMEILGVVERSGPPLERGPPPRIVR